MKPADKKDLSKDIAKERLGPDLVGPSIQEAVDRANYQLSRAIKIVAQSLGISTMEVCMALRIDCDYYDSNSGCIQIDQTQLPLSRQKNTPSKSRGPREGNQKRI